jgi:uncharacterized membrane protein YeaQ/YmgE (transglycosylase-associated protein family)
MWLIIIWLIIGAAVGGGMSWLMEDRGGLSQLWGIFVGVIAAVVGGYVFMLFGAALVGIGPLPIASFPATAVIAAITVLIVGWLVGRR